MTFFLSSAAQRQNQNLPLHESIICVYMQQRAVWEAEGGQKA